MTGLSRIEVDLTAIERNVRIIRGVLARAGGAPVGLCAVLKADAYGLGAVRIAKRLGILGIEMFAVYSPEQARGLIDGAIGAPILVLMPMREFDRSDALYHPAWNGRIHLSVHDSANLDAVIDAADRLGVALPVHLAVDTGMCRDGAPPDEATTLLQRIIGHRRLRLAGVYTHFACADCDAEMTRAQQLLFDSWLEANARCLPDDCIVHEANTFATLRASGYHRAMVRTGLALFGYASEEFEDGAFEFEREALDLVPAVRWLAPIVQLKNIAKGARVGYGAAWTAKRATRLAIVPVGYANGYPIALSNNAKVGFEIPGAQRLYAPVVGRVSMDQLAVDTTDIPEAAVSLGTPVELIGADRAAPNHLPTLAAAAGTIAHELLLGISPNVERRYLALDEARVSDLESMRTLSAAAGAGR